MLPRMGRVQRPTMPLVLRRAYRRTGHEALGRDGCSLVPRVSADFRGKYPRASHDAAQHVGHRCDHCR